MLRFGFDFGGTNIEAASLHANGRVVAQVRGSTPPYEAALAGVDAGQGRGAGGWRSSTAQTSPDAATLDCRDLKKTPSITIITLQPQFAREENRAKLLKQYSKV